MQQSEIDAAWKDYYKLKENEEQTKYIFSYNCIECNSNKLDYCQQYDDTICMDCGLVQYFNCHYKRNVIEYLPDTFNKIKKSVYKHYDYLNRKLDELSCARVIIDSILMNSIIHELNGSIADSSKLKKILRKLGHKQKFIQIPTILNTLYPDKYPPIVLNYHQRKKIETMFLRYIDSFFILVNDGKIKRKNLLNYNFVFYKIFLYLGFKIMIHYFELPKGVKTMIAHQEIWDKICLFNKWI